VDEALKAYGEARALPLTRDLGDRMPGVLRPMCEGDCTHVEYPGVPPDSTACGRQRFAPPGKWAVTFLGTDGGRRTVEVTARSGEVTVVDAPSSPHVEPSMALAWSLSGLTVALLGGAVAAYVWTLDALDSGDTAHAEQARFAGLGDAAGASAASSRVDEARRDAESGRLWTYGLLGASALAAAGATWAWWPQGAHVVAGPGHVQAGLHLTW
jgi:hypothetical protein